MTRSLRLAVVACTFCALSARAADTTLVATNAVWKYRDDGSDQGTAWRAPGFNDTGWASGPAQLGYGDGDEATMVGFGPDPNNRYITTYFRHAFNVTNVSSFTTLRMRLLRDDGAVVYLNGTEVRRDNMPAGSVDYLTKASTQLGTPEEATFYSSDLPNSLVTGTNVLAVEIHQAQTNSSDVSFAMEVVGTSLLVPEGATWRYFKGTSFPSGWTTNGFNDSTWLSGASGFGYGDSDDNTLLNDMTNTVGGYVSVFTRKEFVVPDPAAVVSITLGADYDDGFVAYINNIEVARRNVTSNIINQATLAAGNHEASRGDSSPLPKEFIILTNNLATLLRPGTPSTNLIAVSGHNVSQGSSDLSLIIDLNVATNINLTRGPFIQMPRTNAMTVVWRTDGPADSVVDYGLDTTYTGGTISSSALTNEHVIDIPGLMSGTNYFYRVRSGGQTLSSGEFLRTPRTPAQPWRTILLGDFGNGSAGMYNVANQINARDFDLFLTVGDNIYDVGAADLFDPYWFSIYASSMRRAPSMPVLGNHDIGTANGQPYLDAFYLPTNGPPGLIERNYSYDYANAHFCAVDSNPFDLLQQSAINAIKTWVSNDLASTTQQWKFVYFHHPPYTSVGGHNDNDRVKTNLMPIVEAAGVDAVFVGHNHFYERINAINGVYNICSGGGGAGLTPVSQDNIKPYSNVLVYNVHSFAMFEVNGPKFTLWGIDEAGNQIDVFDLDKSVPFKINGLLDAGASNAWLRAQNGLRLYAAIRSNFLYVATQDAGEGSDHFIYLNNVLSTNRPANWAKDGQVMQWSAFLADENTTTNDSRAGFHGWFNANEQFLTNTLVYRSMTSGLNNNGAANNGVLEGTIDLNAHFGSWPPQIYLAAAPWASTNGGNLFTSAQVPAPITINNIIESSEFLALNTRDIALDLPVANAGVTTSVLVNTSITLNGTGSSAPSGGALSFAWTQLTGPAGSFAGTTTAMPTYTPGNFTGASSNAVLRLVVNDGRFDSDPGTVTVLVKNDSDGDGLTDDEETTGIDDFLTLPNPGGQMTNPNNADTDGDGQSDGAEALAGTDPNSSTSLFRVTSTALGGGGFTIEWPTVAPMSYQVQFRDEMTNTWSVLTNVVANTTSRTNVVDGTATSLPKRFYRVKLLPPP